MSICVCVQNKTSILFSAYYYGKKKSKRVGRPPGGHTNLEGGVKRRGRRRKRRKQLFVHKKRRSSASVDNTPAGSPQVSRITGIKEKEMFSSTAFRPVLIFSFPFVTE